ncbi:MAG: VWA domain-containing protein [Saprospiraceae bacterium]|nr:VWA domain-containing protein [Saprospiraceae bacterium]
MGQLSFQYPTYYLFLCLLVAIGGALLLYYKSKNLQDRPEWQRFVLALLRGLTLFLLGFLLLNPILKRFQNELKKPQAYLVNDESASMYSKDSSWLKSFQSESSKMTDEISDKYEVKVIHFGAQASDNNISAGLSKRTNIDDALQIISDEADPQLLKSVILVSDGIYNSGKNPYYNKLTQSTPIHTLFHGDSTQEKDILIQREYHNEIIYSGDKFSCQFDLQAWQAEGEKMQFTLEKQEGNAWKKISESSDKIDKPNFFSTKEVINESGNPGIYKFKATCKQISGERNVRNNTRYFFIEVLDARKKILLYSSGPHPDLSAIKSALESNKNYEITIKFAPEIPEKMETFNLVIFHQLPTSTQPITSILGRINPLKTSRIFITGSAINLNEFNQSQDAIRITGSGNTPNEAQVLVNSNFPLFTLSEETTQTAGNFPPVNAIFGNYEPDPVSNILFYQKIGKIDTKYPLILFTDKNGIKTGIICGEGIWKWRLSNFARNNNFNAFDELITKITQYSSIKEDRRKFKASPNKNILSETENLIFNAELYNDNYERINTPDVTLTLQSSDSKSYNYTLGKKDNYYEQNIGTLPPGEYSFSAKTNWNNKTLNSEGKFSIQEEDIELNNLVARPDLLRGISEKSGGKFYDKSELNQLASLLNNEDKNKPILFQSLDIRQFIDYKWLLFLILLFLTTEWFLRRYWGSY